MLVVPAQALPNQTLQAQLDAQATTLNIYQYSPYLFMDVLVGGVPVVTGVICQNLNRIVRDLYLGFAGDFVWFDTQGTSDPVYTGVGSRFQLVYLEPADLPAGEG
jgi:hypothetical protein